MSVPMNTSEDGNGNGNRDCDCDVIMVPIELLDILPHQNAFSKSSFSPIIFPSEAEQEQKSVTQLSHVQRVLPGPLAMRTITNGYGPDLVAESLAPTMKVLREMEAYFYPTSLSNNRVGIWDMNNMFWNHKNRTRSPEAIISSLSNSFSSQNQPINLHVLVMRGSYGSSISNLDKILTSISRIIKRPKWRHLKIFILCPKPNVMNLEPEVAHKLREDEDKENLHDRRSQDDIVCWIVKKYIESKKGIACTFTKDKALLAGEIIGMLNVAASFDFQYVNHKHQMITAGNVNPLYLHCLAVC